MNNVIFILVDSVFSDCIGKGRTLESSTPFIDSLIKNGLYASSVYSFGPYTDAATKGLYSGAPTLNDYGYFFGINYCKENHYKTFKENGYETIGFYYPYYLLGKGIEKNIDHSIFIGNFVYSSEWNGKYKYYADLKQNRNLTTIEYALLEKHIDLMFDCWKLFYEKLMNSKESRCIIGDIIEFDDLKKSTKLLEEEVRIYNSGKISYINELLDKGLEHRLNHIDNFSYSKRIKKEFIEEKVYRKNKKFFKKVQQREFLSNFLKNRIKLFEKNNKRTIAGWILSMFSTKQMMKLSKKENWQYSASMNTQIMSLLNVIDSRKEKEKPFYAAIHSEEPHNYVTYFSYDLSDEKEIEREINYLIPLVMNCGKKFKGNLSYQLSLRYTDYCIKKLFDGLKDRNLLNDTTIVITADHGSSYTFNPLRTSVVNNFYKENYKTPLIIWSNNINPQIAGKYDGIYSAEDTLATLCSIQGFKCPEQYKGIPIFMNKDGRSYIITEYMGPGVPDMLHREVWMSIRDNYFMAAYKIPIDKEFDDSFCTELYDLKKDPFERRNVLKKHLNIDEQHISILNNIIRERFNQIKEKRDDFISKLQNE